jgi:hypothetical protein
MARKAAATRCRQSEMWWVSRGRWPQPVDGAVPWGPVVPLVTRCDAEMPDQCKTFSAVDRSQGLGRSRFVLESRITFEVIA